MWQQWANLILGLWIVLSAYLNMTNTSMMTNLTVIGLAIAVFAAWGAMQYQRYEKEGILGHSHR